MAHQVGPVKLTITQAMSSKGIMTTENEKKEQKQHFPESISGICWSVK